MRFSVVFALFALVMSMTGCGRSASNPAEVLEAMQAEYAGDWYETMSFVQTTVNFNPDGSVDTTSWWEAMKLPGRLRIDIGGPKTGNTWIFRNDSIYVFQNGELANASPTLHPLLLLGFDVYFMPLDEVTTKLETLGFDLDTMHETRWKGREVYVIGARMGDRVSPQFWIDKERLVFVRMFQPAGPTGSVLQEIQFNDYQPFGGGWVAPDVQFYADSTITLKEQYHELNFGVPFDEEFFDPKNWQQAEHWFNKPVE